MKSVDGGDAGVVGAIEVLGRGDPGPLQGIGDAMVGGEVEDPADVQQHRVDTDKHRRETVAECRRSCWYVDAMEFRRINALPPYVFATIDALKMEARRAGEDVDRPRLRQPRHPVARRRGREARRGGRATRATTATPPSRGIPKLRLAIADLYRRKFGVELDPETEVCTTIGAKEGFSHLMWVLLGPGDAALVPSPSYPIHIWGPILAGAEVRHVRLGPEQDFFDNLLEAWEESLAAARG